MKHFFLTPPILAPFVVVLAIGVVLISRNFPKVKDVSVHIQNGQTQTAISVDNATPGSSVASSPVAVSPSPTAVPSSTPSTTQQTTTGQNKTSVTVNGQQIPADANGNVDYDQSGNGSNVSVHVKNSSTSQSSYSESNNVSVNVHSSN